MVPDEEMEEHIRSGDCAAIENASHKDPNLVDRGWRNGTLPWINFAMGRDTYRTTVPKLIELGADINLSKGGQPYEDAISSAVNSCELEKLKFLLDHSAKPTKRHAAWNAVVAPRHQFEMVKLLDQYGADIHEVDEGGFSGRYANPLSLAKDYGLDDVVAYLESRGCVMPPPNNEDDEEPILATLIPDPVVEHFTKTIGAPEQLSLIQIVPTGIPVAIHAIPANEHHPYVTLFTTGMADHAMNVPEGAEEYSRAELYIQLPADWKYRDYDDPIWGWPQHWLRSMAQYPHQHDTWLGGPVTLVANEEPPQPLAPNTKFTTLMLLADQSLVTNHGKKIWLYRMAPLYTEERQLEIDQGIPALLNAFDAHDIPMIVDMNRKNVGLL
jgi:hypothetical protein